MKQITLIYKGYIENNFAVMIAKGLEIQNKNIIDWYITDLTTNEVIGAKI